MALTTQTRPIAEALQRFANSKNWSLEYLMEAVTFDELLLFVPVYEAYVPGIREKIRKQRVKDGQDASADKVENELFRRFLPLVLEIMRESRGKLN